MKKRLTGIVMAALIFTGCGTGRPDAATDGHEKTTAATAAGEHEEETEEEHTPGEIHFSPEQAEAAGLTVETVEAGPFARVLRTSGRVQTSQGDEAIIAATANGVISFANPSLTEGTPLRAGETVVTISSRDLPEGDPNIKTKIEYETALKEYRRAEGLAADKIVSTRELEQARQRYETAKAAYDAQAANITEKGVKVTSPIGGFLKNRLVGQGEYVQVGQPLAVVAQNRRLQLRADVPERYFGGLRDIGGANFKTSYGEKVHRLSDLNGRLLSFGKVSDGSSYIPVTFEFDNVGEILPGSFAEIYLLGAPKSEVISVPLSALTEEQGLYFVYVQLDEDCYRKQEVTPGGSDGTRIEIRSGLTPGEKVVTHGAYQVKLASVSSVVPEGHTHAH